MWCASIHEVTSNSAAASRILVSAPAGFGSCQPEKWRRRGWGVYQVVVDHTTPITLQKSRKLKILYWCFDQCLYIPWRLNLLSKTYCASIFLYNFFHSHSFNKIFIISGKSDCCNDTFNDIRLTIIKENRKVIFMLLKLALH